MRPVTYPRQADSRTWPPRRRVLVGLLGTLCFGVAWAEAPVDATGNSGSIAFYYGDQPPISDLSRFELAVVEPDTGFEPLQAKDGITRWIAYVSVGEVHQSRSYYHALPKSWIVGRNPDWQSDIIDQTAPGWPEFFVEHVIAPLWQRGYTGFFLDTLDSYQLVVKDDTERERNQNGLIDVIKAIHSRFPDAALILNRGFELLPAIHQLVDAVAFESLFKGWNETRGEYTDVPAADRHWLVDQTRRVKQLYSLPVIAIDYCAPANTQCARETVQRICGLGLVPYVADGRLQTVGFSAWPALCSP
ncbi:hypothetical protein EKL30_01515 [Candidimonas sp. SYP-B2681]|uniref:endo alpha-1,4 polygalactosaminidase n=1 Tax=Candidimonas sp. SYP-B2681 TaxID=2497686 RepID=UPI000F87F856|nr:endo alpha-1,4 polygalactosaminidase [Candidimonas sp. SYP-B2681]RTZ47699.1 hypothetical protein EKL30_01515 [Candidimonas sp. SYP-B2681]